jgi:hypothetical protein
MVGRRVLTGRVHFGGLTAIRSRLVGSAGRDGSDPRVEWVSGSNYFFSKISKISKILIY